eukprot:SAG31_NODE_217_length_19988_cov_53.300820_6_plen_150_part_00
MPWWAIAKTSRRTNCRPVLPQDLPHQPDPGQQRHPHVPSVALADCAVGLGFDQLQHGRWHFSAIWLAPRQCGISESDGNCGGRSKTIAAISERFGELRRRDTWSPIDVARSAATHPVRTDWNYLDGRGQHLLHHVRVVALQIYNTASDE